VWAKVHHTLVMADRERAGREASPSAAIIDSHHRQPDRQDGGSKGDSKGYDAGKKVHGRKRHIMTDTAGRLLAVDVHAADIQDRDGAKGVLKRSRRSFPFVETVFAPLADAMHRLPGNGTVPMPGASSLGQRIRPTSRSKLSDACPG